MTDDIVTRLRNMTILNEGVIDMTINEAADEIERLRADRDRWRNWASDYLYTDPDCECPLCDQVREAYENGDR